MTTLLERITREGAPIHEQLARLEMENVLRIYGGQPVKLRLTAALQARSGS